MDEINVRTMKDSIKLGVTIAKIVTIGKGVTVHKNGTTGSEHEE